MPAVQAGVRPFQPFAITPHSMLGDLRPKGLLLLRGGRIPQERVDHDVSHRRRGRSLPPGKRADVVVCDGPDERRLSIEPDVVSDGRIAIAQ